jgi:hypothetical protein
VVHYSRMSAAKGGIFNHPVFSTISPRKALPI